WTPSFHAVGIGWTLHMQGRGWVDGSWYREIEAPLDSCWLLDAMIGDGGRTIGFISLTRPRSARRFTAGGVQFLGHPRRWLAHAFRRPLSGSVHQDDQAPIITAGPPVLSGQLIVSSDARLVHQTSGLELLLRILAGEPGNFTRYVPVRDRLPVPVLKLL